MGRGGRVWSLVMAAAVALAASQAQAGEPQDGARRHFKSGVTLFQNGDFKGALAEFEASQRDLPSASTLQNIALCLTRLHRYVQALETLDRIQEQHGASLSAEDRAAVEASIKELSQLVGTVTVKVSPPGAQVWLNGKAMTPESLARPMRLSSGEYTFKAEAPHHATLERTETIAGGDERAIELQLQPQSAEVDIQASDREAAIAVDGQAMAYGAWKGTLTAGEHLVQVYKAGYRPFATRIPLKAGDKLELHPLLGPPDVAPARALSSPVSAVPIEAPQRGWYGLFAASTLVPLFHPDGFESKDAWTGAAYGVRVGYRFWKPVAFEAMLDGGKQSVGPGQYQSETAGTQNVGYELTTGRVGGNVRLLAGGRVARFSAVFGVGAVTHQVKIGDHPQATGADSYFLIENGVQFNVGRVLLEGSVLTILEGVAAVKEGEKRLYTEHTVVPQLGLGFRVGYGEWGRW